MNADTSRDIPASGLDWTLYRPATALLHGRTAEWWHRPVLVLTVGDRASQAATGSLLTAHAAALDVPVLSADAGVYLGPRTLITGSSFQRWKPPGRRSAGAPAMVRLGPMLPAIAAPTRSLSRPEPQPAPEPLPWVLFNTGSHLAVLAVDEPDEAREPVRVLLREVPEKARANAEADDRARLRLHESLKTATGTEIPAGGGLLAQWRHPIGVRDDASPFALAGEVQ